MNNLEEEIREIIRDALYQGQSVQRWCRPDIFEVDETVINKATDRVLVAIEGDVTNEYSIRGI